ncbi:MAG: metallophosphoesterase [Opitutaceae bacterium]|nr:metallophosphoesterase [Opitutaceae bacterium]
MTKGRFIAIGDVHGCVDELAALIEKLEIKPEDQIIYLGDLVNRGPDSHGVISIARKTATVAIMGNHEQRLLKYRKKGSNSTLSSNEQKTFEQLTPKDWKFIEQMIPTYYVPEIDTVFVHGGFLPQRAWQDQPLSIITNIQVLVEGKKPAKRRDYPEAPYWADFWEGPPFVVYGHTPRDEIYKKPQSIGIDTSCAGGGKLTAYCLPGKEIVQVPSAREYYPRNGSKTR